MKTKTRIRLTLLFSLMLSAISAAKQEQGVITSSKTNTIASAIELQNGNIETICPSYVHKGGIKKLARTSYAFRGKATRKGFILTELWPVATIEEMNIRIAKRDGKVISETPTVVAKAIPVPAEVPVAPVVEIPSPASKDVASATLVESNPPPAFEPPTVQVVEGVKVVTPAPSKGVPYAVMSEAEALLPTQTGEVKNTPLVDSNPPPTLEEIEDLEKILAKAEAEEKAKANASLEPPVPTEEPAPVALASAPAPVEVTPPVPTQLPVPTSAPKIDPTQMSVGDRLMNGDFATTLPSGEIVVEEKSSNVAMNVIYTCGAILVLLVLYMSRKKLFGGKRIKSTKVVSVAPTTIARRPDSDPDNDPTPTPPKPSGPSWKSSVQPTEGGKHVSIKEVLAQQKANKPPVETTAQKHTIVAGSIEGLADQLIAQGHKIPAVPEQVTEETSVASATVEIPPAPAKVNTPVTPTNIVHVFPPIAAEVSSIPQAFVDATEKQSQKDSRLIGGLGIDPIVPSHSPLSAGRNLPAERDESGKSGSLRTAAKGKQGKRLRTEPWDTSKPPVTATG